MNFLGDCKPKIKVWGGVRGGRGYEGEGLGKRYESGISNGKAFRYNVFLRAIPFEIPAGGIKHVGGGVWNMGGGWKKKYAGGCSRKIKYARGGFKNIKIC